MPLTKKSVPRGKSDDLLFKDSDERDINAIVPVNDNEDPAHARANSRKNLTLETNSAAAEDGSLSLDNVSFTYFSVIRSGTSNAKLRITAIGTV